MKLLSQSIETSQNFSVTINKMAQNSPTPSITDGVHRNENFVEIIPVFSTFSNFFNTKQKK